MTCPTGMAGAQAPAEAVGFAGEGLHLYPLGWSSEGRWGALIGRSGASGTKTIRLLVIDAVTDETLLLSDPMEWPGPEGFDAFWARYGRSVLEKADSFDLESTLRPDVRDARFITGGYEYEFIMNPPSPASGAYTLRIRSSRGDIKDVYRSPADSAPDRTILLGALVSPFEERALAIIREAPAYGMGPASYRFSGAHLTLGFSFRQTDPDVPLSSGSLLSAVFNGQEYLVRGRLAAGADPEQKDERGYTAVLIAARLGHWTMLADLLAAGASPRPLDDSGRSALHHAAYAGETDAVKALLAAGASQ